VDLLDLRISFDLRIFFSLYSPPSAADLDLAVVEDWRADLADLTDLSAGLSLAPDFAFYFASFSFFAGLVFAFFFASTFLSPFYLLPSTFALVSALPLVFLFAAAFYLILSLVVLAAPVLALLLFLSF
jgi:hypothetical protein